MLDIERMIEYNIHKPSMQRPVQRELSTVERIRPDDTFKWNDDDFLPVQSKPMQGLDVNDKDQHGVFKGGFLGAEWMERRKEEGREGDLVGRIFPSLDEIILGLC